MVEGIPTLITVEIRRWREIQERRCREDLTDLSSRAGSSLSGGMAHVCSIPLNPGARALRPAHTATTGSDAKCASRKTEPQDRPLHHHPRSYPYNPPSSRCRATLPHCFISPQLHLHPPSDGELTTLWGPLLHVHLASVASSPSPTRGTNPALAVSSEPHRVACTLSPVFQIIAPPHSGLSLPG